MPQDDQEQQRRERILSVLDMEASGSLPEEWKVRLQQLRAEGLLPPPLPGRGPYRPPIPPAPEGGPTLEGLAQTIASVPVIQGKIGKEIIRSAVPAATGLAGARVAGVPGMLTGTAAGSAAINALMGEPVGSSTALDVAMSAIPEVPGAIMRVGRAAARRIKPAITAGGQRVISLLGKENVLPYQIADSPFLDFMRTFGEAGYGGGRLLRAQERQAGIITRKGTDIPAQIGQTYKAAPAGRALGQSISQRLKTTREPLYQQYRDILARIGDRPAVSNDEILGALRAGGDEASHALRQNIPTIRDLHIQRRDLLRQSREIMRSERPDRAEILRLNQEAERIMERMIAAGGSELRVASDAYRKFADQYYNPTVQQILGRKPEQLVDLFMNPVTRLRHFKVRVDEPALGVPELVRLVEDASSPQEWNNFRATVMNTLLKRSYDPKLRTISGVKLIGREGIEDAGLIGKMDTGFDALFPDQANTLRTFAQAVRDAQKPGRGQGRIFITFRQPAAAVAVGGALVGAGAVTAVTGGILITPWLAARALNDPRLITYMLRAAKAPTPAAAHSAGRDLLKAAARLGLFAATSPDIDSPPEP